jgi:hypothetical protein
MHAMKEAVHFHSSDLVFNLDKVGIREWEDQKLKKVVIGLTSDRHTAGVSAGWSGSSALNV